jgi:hypothetical protein
MAPASWDKNDFKQIVVDETPRTRYEIYDIDILSNGKPDNGEEFDDIDIIRVGEVK